MGKEKLMQKEFLAIYDRYVDRLFRYCYFRISDRELAKDIVQETFMKTYDYAVKNGITSLKNIQAFLYRVLKNVMIDEFRKKKPSSLEKLTDEGFQPTADISGGTAKIHAKIEAEKMMKILLLLNEQEREVVVMRYIDDLTPSEIASVLGENANTISVRLNRSLEKIRNIIK